MSFALMRKLAPLSLLAVPLLIPVFVRSGDAAPVQVPAVPAGARGVAFGTSFGSDMTNTVRMFPNARIGRVFEGTLRPTLPALPASYQIWLSFNTDPALVASGGFNAQFATILQGWNRSGRIVYWDWQHEADNPSNHFNPATIRAGWAQLLSVERRYPSSRVKSMSIYEGYLLHPSRPHGDPALWYVDADVLGFDTYMLDSVPRAMNYAKAKGKPWAIPEFGYHGGDAADIAYVTSTIKAWAGYPPIGASWFNQTTSSHYSQPLSEVPSTLAYLRALATPPPAVPKLLTTVSPLIQLGHPDIVRAHLTYGTHTTYGATPVYLGEVTLWKHYAGSSTWTRVGTTKTNASGWAYIATRPTYWTAYRWTFSGTLRLYGTTSRTVVT